MANLIITWILIILVILFIIHCPIFKPWFGFCRPPNHKGKWFQ